MTARKYCDFVLHTASGPDSVERIPRDEPLIAKILDYLTALWTRVIAPEIFEMRVPMDFLPFVLAEPVDCLDTFQPSPASADSCLGCRDPTTCTSLASPVDSLEPASATPTESKDAVVPVSSASLSDLCEPQHLICHHLSERLNILLTAHILLVTKTRS